MTSLARLADGMDRIVRSIGQGIGWIILPLILTIMFDVVTRKVDFIRLYFSEFTINYGYSISTILQDLQWHFHAMLLMLTFGFGYLRNAHVRVDIFREMLPRRQQAWVEFFGLLFLAVPFLVLMIRYGWDLMYLSWQQGEGSDSMTGIDYRYVIKAFVPLGFVVALMSVIATLIRLGQFLFGSAEQKDYALSKLEIFPDDSDLQAAREAAERALRENGGGS
ncbi:MAG: TRAP transporter small permease subunit [Pseudomonadota bacterium]